MTTEFSPTPFSPVNPFGPLTPTELLQRTFAMYREQPGVVFGLILILALVQIIILGMMASCGAMLHPEFGTGVLLLQIVFVLCAVGLGLLLLCLLTQIIQGAFFFAVTASLQKRPIRVGDVCSLALDRLKSLIGVSVQIFFRIIGYELLIGIVLGAMGLLAALASGMIGSTHATDAAHKIGAVIFMIPVFFILAVVGFLAIFWVIVRYAISIPACLAENLSGSAAIRRSITLSSKSRGRLYAIYVFLFAMVIVTLMLILPFSLMAAHAGRHSSTFFLLQAIPTAINMALSVWMVSFLGIATTFAYYDLRVRKEGWGVSVTQAALDVPPVLLAPAIDDPFAGQPQHDL